MSKIKELMDLYSKPINFTFKKKSLYQTNLGGFVSIVVFGSLFIYLGYLIYDMLQRKYPYILRTTFYNDIPLNITIWKDISYENFNLTREWIDESIIDKNSYWYASFGFRNNGATPTYLMDIDPAYASLHIDQVSVSNGTLIYKPLNFSKCNKFGRNFDQQFKDLSLNQTYCLNDKYNLKGIQGREESSWMQVRLSICNGLPICKNSSLINSYLQPLQFEIYYQQRYLNTTGLGSDATYSGIQQFYWDIVPTLTKITKLDFGIDKIISYDGFFPDFLGGTYETSYLFNVRNFNVHLRDLDDEKNVLVLFFLPSRENYVYKRRFNDIIAQFAAVGGISSIVIYIGYLFVASFSYFRLNESLMNNFYSIIPFQRTKYVNKSFNVFLQERYNILMSKYFEKNFDNLNVYLNITHKNNEIDIKDVEIEMSEMGENKGKENRDQIEENQSLVDYSSYSLNIHTQEKVIDQTYKVTDDEGLMSQYEDLNALQRYFTLRRIESLFGVSKKDRDRFLVQYKEKSSSNKGESFSYKMNFFEKIFADKNTDYLYRVEKSVYDGYKYTCYDKLHFNVFQVLAKICCSCCFKISDKKKTYDIPIDIFNEANANDQQIQSRIKDKYEGESKLTKNFLIYDTAKKRLGLDFDLVSVLKTVEDFDRFKKIFFDDVQRGLYDSISQPIIKVKPGESLETVKLSEEESDQKNLNDFRHNLMTILEKGKLTKVDKKLLEHVGLDLEDIKKLAQDAQNFSDIKENYEINNKEEFGSKTQEKNDDGDTEEPNVVIDPNNHEFINEINKKFTN